MLMVVTETQILNPQQVCCGCLLANANGEPRWKGGKLGCGHPLGHLSPYGACTQRGEELPEQYECEMGFRLTQVS